MSNPFPKTKDISRRGFVYTVAAAAGTLGALGGSLAGPRPGVQTPLSPEAALNEQMLCTKTAEKQEPVAAVLSYADSRVPVEIVFDQTIGHVFVCRVAGNVTTPQVIASLEYGAGVLGITNGKVTTVG